MKTIKGKVVIVTGAASGLGKETAIAFAKEGANLVICDLNKPELEKVEQLILSFGISEVLSLRTDVSSEKEVKNLVRIALKKFQRIDYLINNAAIFEQYYLINSPLDSWEYQFHNNATSVFLMMREVLPEMRKQKSGMIINITSGLAREGAAGFGTYAASKAAIEALSFSVDDEEHKHGIRVGVFNPGVMKTGLSVAGDNPADIAPYLVTLAQKPSILDKRVIQVEDLETPAKI